MPGDKTFFLGFPQIAHFPVGTFNMGIQTVPTLHEVLHEAIDRPLRNSRPQPQNRFSSTGIISSGEVRQTALREPWASSKTATSSPATYDYFYQVKKTRRHPAPRFALLAHSDYTLKHAWGISFMSARQHRPFLSRQNKKAAGGQSANGLNLGNSRLSI
ncbi:MAG: hypothetical protein HY579_04295 [Nitrospinae bacterium]|nr:hypothetical protein [Nitrospinota bacterium]